MVLCCSVHVRGLVCCIKAQHVHWGPWRTIDLHAGSRDVSPPINLGQRVCAPEGQHHLTRHAAAQPGAVCRIALLAQPA